MVYFRSLKDHPNWEEASKALIGLLDSDMIAMIQELFPPNYPPADVYLTEKEVIVLLGIQSWCHEDEIIMSPVSGGLEIKGKKYSAKPVEVKALCTSQEIFRGDFCRIIAIPCQIDPENFSVQYNNGLMEIRFRQLPGESEDR